MRYSTIGALALVALSLVTLSCTRNHAPAPSGDEDAKGSAAGAAAPNSAFYRPEQVSWKDGPPSLPPGAKFAILEGDPSKDGFFCMRIMMPDGYRVAPHWHPKVERLTVISGTLHLGMGETFDQSAAQALPAGSYGFMPPRMKHFAWTEGSTVLQLATHGPWEIHYLNPADDPRQQK